MTVAERDAARRAPPAETNRWLVLVLVCLAQFMVVLDATITNVALSSIQTDLGFSATDLQWVINGYTLLFGGFLLLGGRAGDLVGRKRISSPGVDLLHQRAGRRRRRAALAALRTRVARPGPPGRLRRRRRRVGRAGLAQQLIKRFDVRWIAVAGMTIAAVGLYVLRWCRSTAPTSGTCCRA